MRTAKRLKLENLKKLKISSMVCGPRIFLVSFVRYILAFVFWVLDAYVVRCSTFWTWMIHTVYLANMQGFTCITLVLCGIIDVGDGGNTNLNTHGGMIINQMG